jgi:hypothetical protein
MRGGGPPGPPVITVTDRSGSERTKTMKNEEIFRVEELEARLEMQPLPNVVHSNCTSSCDGEDPVPEGGVDY